ncbi:hypothetical protein BCV69DRAFT_295830 [Microstroma glucosiphilum]|uniref:Uncharacterized protein n=1 Tax=Pseudomicrostroma glucosiphilum TaxID=1684307 RepID=A0A316UE52_9BASI|nr:hypothetical protein BCV69DRAFT_295830 [Pseudomicrostroma glucosiphilum]PWN23499.1 hypothetical protein BCV69DRAFT_295830 [Pseudomicrostroma glucosiphilum]
MQLPYLIPTLVALLVAAQGALAAPVREVALSSYPPAAARPTSPAALLKRADEITEELLPSTSSPPKVSIPGRNWGFHNPLGTPSSPKGDAATRRWRKQRSQRWQLHHLKDASSTETTLFPEHDFGSKTGQDWPDIHNDFALRGVEAATKDNCSRWAHQRGKGRAVTALEVVWANEGEGDIEEELAEYRSEQINVILLKLEWRGVGGEAAVDNLPRLPAEFEDWRGKARVSVVLQDWERQGWEQYDLSAPVRNLPDGVREVNRRQRVLPLPTRWFVDPLPGAPERFPVFLEDFAQVLKDRLLPACVESHAPER